MPVTVEGWGATVVLTDIELQADTDLEFLLAITVTVANRGGDVLDLDSIGLHCSGTSSAGVGTSFLDGTGSGGFDVEPQTERQLVSHLHSVTTEDAECDAPAIVLSNSNARAAQETPGPGVVDIDDDLGADAYAFEVEGLRDAIDAAVGGAPSVTDMCAGLAPSELAEMLGTEVDTTSLVDHGECVIQAEGETVARVAVMSAPASLDRVRQGPLASQE